MQYEAYQLYCVIKFENEIDTIVMEKNLANPYICMTNIGISEDNKLFFKGSPIINTYMCGSIKYRPHFQIALSSYGNKITFSSNLYGSVEDREAILNCFTLLDEVLFSMS